MLFDDNQFHAHDPHHYHYPGYHEHCHHPHHIAVFSNLAKTTTVLPRNGSGDPNVLNMYGDIPGDLYVDNDTGVLWWWNENDGEWYPLTIPRPGTGDPNDTHESPNWPGDLYIDVESGKLYYYDPVAGEWTPFDIDTSDIQKMINDAIKNYALLSGSGSAISTRRIELGYHEYEMFNCYIEIPENRAFSGISYIRPHPVAGAAISNFGWAINSEASGDPCPPELAGKDFVRIFCGITNCSGSAWTIDPNDSTSGAYVTCGCTFSILNDDADQSEGD